MGADASFQVSQPRPSRTPLTSLGENCLPTPVLHQAAEVDSNTCTSLPRLRAVGYSRVSTGRQLIRPEDDRRRIEHQCAAWNYELVEWLEDRALSGTVDLADRPRGRRLCELLAARQPWADVIVVTNLDRLSRDSLDGLQLLKAVMARARRAHPVALVTLDDHLDLTTPWGRMGAKQRILFAELERELIGERTSHALCHQRTTGRAWNRDVYGWDNVGGHLVPNAEEQRQLARMRGWLADGVNLNKVATRLNAEGVPGKRGGKWQQITVKRCLAVADEVGSAAP